ncbi:MAG TPA: histidine phosphatase family protein [Stellaceae bacterium]|nr:histidine phosphatase family protein [Stellaceae bacterium]
MTIFLLRHGETAWNLERRFQGRFDSPLTERGAAQARAIGRLLAALPDAASAPIVASPQGRARRTAEIILEQRGDPGELRLDDRLRELSLGSWDGLTYGDVAERLPGLFDGDGRHEWYFRSPDGESYDAFAERIADWLSETHRLPLLIVVAHGLVTRVMRGLYAGLPRAAALTLPVRQDRIFRLSSGLIEEITVPDTQLADRG